MEKPDKCKTIECTECGNFKYCEDYQEYAGSVDKALTQGDKKKAHKEIREWKGI